MSFTSELQRGFLDNRFLYIFLEISFVNFQRVCKTDIKDTSFSESLLQGNLFYFFSRYSIYYSQLGSFNNSSLSDSISFVRKTFISRYFVTRWSIMMERFSTSQKLISFSGFLYFDGIPTINFDGTPLLYGPTEHTLNGAFVRDEVKNALGRIWIRKVHKET